MRENIVIFLGPSGSGKSTLIAEIANKERRDMLPTLVPSATRICVDGVSMCLMDTPADIMVLFNGSIFIRQSKIVVIVCSSRESLENDIPHWVQRVRNVGDNPFIILVLRNIKKESAKIPGVSEIVEWDVPSLVDLIRFRLGVSKPALRLAQKSKEEKHCQDKLLHFTLTNADWRKKLRDWYDKTLFCLVVWIAIMIVLHDN